MKNTQKGRSMVEMLGVLAIIGVLSVGGIAGYTVAMNRYRANQILDMASKTAVIAQTMNAGAGGTACTGGVANCTSTGLAWTELAGVGTFTAVANNDSSIVTVTLNAKPTGGVPVAMTSIAGKGQAGTENTSAVSGYDGNKTIYIKTN